MHKAAAKLVYNGCKGSRISLLLRDFRRLLVPERNKFCPVVFALHCRNLARDLHWTTDDDSQRRLYPVSNVSTLIVRLSRLNYDRATIARAFSVAEPCLWNDLAVDFISIRTGFAITILMKHLKSNSRLMHSYVSALLNMSLKFRL